VNFILIKSDLSSNYQSINISWDKINDLTKSPDYDNSKRTAVFVAGFNNDLKSDVSVQMTKAFITRSNEFNIFLLDWSRYSNNQTYFAAAADVIPVRLF
jgi:hypothetical protein